MKTFDNLTRNENSALDETIRTDKDKRQPFKSLEAKAGIINYRDIHSVTPKASIQVSKLFHQAKLSTVTAKPGILTNA